MLSPFRPEPLNIKELSRSAKKPGPELPMRHFIRAGEDYTLPDRPVPMPYFRRSFTVRESLSRAELTVCGLGLCESYVNGVCVSRGRLGPYRANPDHLVYFDVLDITHLLHPGKNAAAFWLGTGLQSSVVRKWQWRELPWRGPVQLAFRLRLVYAGGQTETLFSDEETRTAPSPLRFCDYHGGEDYDARLELPGWNEASFDDSTWQASLPAPTPRGTPRICEAEPIGCFEQLTPVQILPYENGFLYDFGVNSAGVCRLKLCGAPGQKITLFHFERMLDGRPYLERICAPDLRSQLDTYICAGGEAEWQPRFTYHGFRYVLIEGLTPEQAVPETLTFLVMHSSLARTGSFSCGDPTANRLVEITLRSDLSNFFWFPTDCPHREKHGWTADAALSAEQTLCYFDASASYREWLRSIYAAMTPGGGLPGIVPTGGTTYDWGNGPAWDGVLAELPYRSFLFTGDRQIVQEAAVPLMRYLTYLHTRRDETGTICFGLGDWCDCGQPELFCATPQRMTDTVCAMEIARKAEFLFTVLGQTAFGDFAAALHKALWDSARQALIDPVRLLAYGETQTAQAMAIDAGLFLPEELPGAMRQLRNLIADADDHFSGGVLGARVIFRVLAEHGEAELAAKMILRPDAPSYGSLLSRGATSLWEEMDAGDPSRGDENHHFWGDIAAWFQRYPGGIRILSADSADYAPVFLSAMDHASAEHTFPNGFLSARWQREGKNIRLTVETDGLNGSIRLPEGYAFADGSTVRTLHSGEYLAVSLF